MEKEIFVSVVKSNKSDNNVWAVAITGEEQPSAHCKSAYKAMRYMFLLKKLTGLYISGDSLSQLSQEIARIKAEKVSEEASVETVGAAQEPVEEPKPKRKPRTKKNQESAAVPM